MPSRSPRYRWFMRHKRAFHEPAFRFRPYDHSCGALTNSCERETRKPRKITVRVETADLKGLSPRLPPNISQRASKARHPKCTRAPLWIARYGRQFLMRLRCDTSDLSVRVDAVSYARLSPTSKLRRKDGLSARHDAVAPKITKITVTVHSFGSRQGPTTRHGASR